MEVRGIGGVFGPEDLQVGRFYRRQDHRGGTILFQVVEEEVGGVVGSHVLEFLPSSDGGTRLESVYGGMMFAEIPDVHLKVDSHSLAGDEFSTSMCAGMLLVTKDTALLLATPQRNYGWAAVDLITGKVTSTRPSGWAWFSRWSLVMDDGEDETELVAYDLARRS
jgi:hypothetical protein